MAVSIVLEGDDPLSAAAPVRWAVEHLQAALGARGVEAHTFGRAADAASEVLLAVAGGPSAVAREALQAAGVSLPDVPEALALVPATVAGRRVLLAAGSDVRGLVYAVLELADRVRQGDQAVDPLAPLRALLDEPPVVERPANRIRSILRVFSSDVEDLGWYHDRDFWSDYLAMLATHRFNRFQLALGIGFDFARHMRDSYFYFPYPFLVSVPGYDVRAGGVSDAERQRNLDTLRAIARETRRRGLHFQLGIWANVYVFEDSPDVNHPIVGLTPETHAPYCRDAIRTLLQAVPEIDGLTIRVHGESGIPEGSYDFWRTLFSGIAACGRRVEIDMHAKGIDQEMIDLALQVSGEVDGGLPVVVSPKFWAEHLGLPYHQAEIRAVERPDPLPSGSASPPRPDSFSSAPDSPQHTGGPVHPTSPTRPAGQSARLMALSTGTRRFTRYGYADLLTEDRRYGVLFRIWPGTHRLLLWGDPATGRAYGRAFSFCGADGVELFEPLSFSGRRGSGLPNGRNPYADESLYATNQASPNGTTGPNDGNGTSSGANDAWQKYLYTYRLWGRLLYNPEADAETWRRALRREFGAAAPAAEAALASASRILPLITTAHHPSAANNRYWPEIYTNMPIVEAGRPQPYSDTAAPRRFTNVSALDPEVFASIEEHVEELLSGNRRGRYSPLDVAHQLDDLASEATVALQKAAASAPDPNAPSFRRWAVDIRIEAALGRFFAAKLRAGTGYTLYTRTGDAGSLRDAVSHYREARAAWEEAVRQAQGIYKEDLTFGPEPFLRGHWVDRLAAIDQDVRDMEAVFQQVDAGTPADAAPSTSGQEPTTVTLAAALRERRPETPPQHTPSASFTPGTPFAVEATARADVTAVRLHFRHVNQAERFQQVDMQHDPVGVTTGSEETGGVRVRATIPGAYTRSRYPLQYFFELHDSSGAAWRWPGLGTDLTSQPYFVVRVEGARMA